LVWAKAIGSLNPEVGASIAYDPEGSGVIYITGNFYATVDFDPGVGVFEMTTASWPPYFYPDMFILKLNTFGDFMWAKSIGGYE
jgi:hypothetical protein